MKFFILALCIFFSEITLAQNSFSEDDAKKVVDTFFEGFHKGDTLLMKSVMLPEMKMQTVFATKDGSNKIVDGDANNFVGQIGKRPDDQKWDERLLDYKIQIDGNLAHVWTPYEFWFNGEFSHCGANAFTLAKTDEGWMIVHLIDSRRKSSCR